MATLGPGILVEGNSEEESAVLREEIAEQPTQPSLPAPEPAGSDQEDDDTFIVVRCPVKSEFLKLEAGRGGETQGLGVHRRRCLQIKSFLDIGSDETAEISVGGGSTGASDHNHIEDYIYIGY
ncbi:hypothetical protein AK812_SmicGene2043 [Symbiodinium microadriaticum]|uniref:Uncharacterized protein n=1 Tax=Symbiodinium microadriaticum TaxID=2951 RepID=A0A1Q9F2K3_SYMMI|nr:hypothetical protein AK812_SmicGene2043 [Symbiodinium microadriaticum]